LRDENGAAVLSVDGTTVKATGERVATGVNPYAIDISSDGHWAVIGNTGVNRTVADADVVSLVDVSKRPFRTVQQISVPATPEGVAISPDGKWIAVSSMAGSNLLANDPGRAKLGKVGLYSIEAGWATYVNEVPGGEAAQGVVFTEDSKNILVQFDVESRLRSTPFAAASWSTPANASSSRPDLFRSARCRADGGGPRCALPYRHAGDLPASRR
jgi:DNA-binding beta-propeller fold protein YncE